MERISAMSSTHAPRCGSNSDSSIPHWPCFLNLRGLPIRTADSLRMKAKRTFFVSDSGSLSPSSSFSLGFGSNRSICDGAPSIKMKMHALAFGAKWGAFGPNGLAGTSAASKPCSRNIEASASRPNPLAADVRKSRRVNLMMSSGLMSFSRNKLIKVHHCARQRHPCCHFHAVFIRFFRIDQGFHALGPLLEQARLDFVKLDEPVHLRLRRRARQNHREHTAHLLSGAGFRHARDA